MAAKNFLRTGWPALLAVAAGLILPAVLPSYYLATMTLIGLNSIIVVGLIMLLGQAGQISLGHAAFFAFGSYVSAIAVLRFGLNAWAAMGLAAVVTAGVAYLVGIPTMKLRGYYLALGTLAFGMIVELLLLEGGELTGGVSGISGIPKFQLGPWKIQGESQSYYLVWFFVLILIWGARNFTGTSYGRELKAIHSSEIAAEAVGIDTFGAKLRVFIISAVYASLAGSLYAHYTSFVSPSAYSFHASIQFLTMAVLGGMYSVWGGIIGSGVLLLLGDVIRKLISFSGQGLVGQVESLIYGGMLLGALVLLPRGIAGALESSLKPWSRSSGPGLPVAGGAPVKIILSHERPSSPLLEVKGISKSFGGLLALRNISLSAYGGEILAVIGPNGAGKTTFFNLIAGVMPPDSGEIYLDGEPVSGLKSHRMARKGVSRTFQQLEIFVNLTVLENVMLAQHMYGSLNLIDAFGGTRRMKDQETRLGQESLGWLEFLGLSDKAAWPAGNLSFGQQRMLEIARALGCRPKVLLLDEPMSGLSPAEKESMVATIRKLKDMGLSLILVEHDVEVIMEVADRIMVLDCGEKIAEGTAHQVQNDPRVVAAYLGEEAYA